MLEEVIFAGFGGQGIMYMGKLLSYSAMKNNFETTWSSSYGIEVRGGTANCIVKISDKPIAVPILDKPNTFVAMNELSLEKFKDNVGNGGLLIINSSTIEDYQKYNIREDIVVVKFPFSHIAQLSGDHRIGNMAALGVYSWYKKNIPLDLIEEAMDEMTPVHRRNLLGPNKKALRSGYQQAQEQQKKV